MWNKKKNNWRYLVDLVGKTICQIQSVPIKFLHFIQDQQMSCGAQLPVPLAAFSESSWIKSFIEPPQEQISYTQYLGDSVEK